MCNSVGASLLWFTQNNIRSKNLTSLVRPEGSLWRNTGFLTVSRVWQYFRQFWTFHPGVTVSSPLFVYVLFICSCSLAKPYLQHSLYTSHTNVHVQSESSVFKIFLSILLSIVHDSCLVVWRESFSGLCSPFNYGIVGEFFYIPTTFSSFYVYLPLNRLTFQTVQVI